MLAISIGREFPWLEGWRRRSDNPVGRLSIEYGGPHEMRIDSAQVPVPVHMCLCIGHSSSFSLLTAALAGPLLIHIALLLFLITVHILCCAV